MIRATSYHGFGGAFAVAAKHLNIKLDAVIEPEGFGVGAVEANRLGLGFTGPVLREKKPAPRYADLIFGNPPCSGFSSLNVSKGANAAGPDSPINQCMWDLIDYAGSVNPKMVIFESVQGAGTKGHELMLALTEKLRQDTGDSEWQLTSTFMSGATVGAAQVRRRYFFVAHRIPFGVKPPPIERVITYNDAIGDLIGLQPIKEPQPYGSQEPSNWARALRNASGYVTDMHMDQSLWSRRHGSIAKYMQPGDDQRVGLKRAIKANDVDPVWEGKDLDWIVNGDYFNRVVMLKPNEAGRVITGAGGTSFLHWAEERILTVRETARLMGFPDWFDWGWCSASKAYLYLGKQVPVQSWEWILKQAKAALEGEPYLWKGLWTGTNWDVNITLDYKAVYDSRTQEQPVDARSAQQIAAMSNRPPYTEPAALSEPRRSQTRATPTRQTPAPRVRATRSERPIDPGPGFTFTANGAGPKIKMRGGTLDQYVYDEVIRREMYTRYATLEPDDVWADVGGHIGTFSALIAPKVREVIAFEPDHENAVLFRENIRANELFNVTLYEALAVENDDAERSFFLNQKKNTGAHSQHVRRGRVEVKVPCVNLPAKLQTHHVTKIKLDVEGSELELVPAIDWAPIRELHMEYHFNARGDKNQERFHAMMAFLRERFNYVETTLKAASVWTTMIHASQEPVVDRRAVKELTLV